MNCKLEKFWNAVKLTVNASFDFMNCKLEKFWNELHEMTLEEIEKNEL